MKNKKNLLIIIAIVVIILVACISCYFLFKSKDNTDKEKYVIEQWCSFEQRIIVDVEDKSILKYTKSTLENKDSNLLTGGQNSLFEIEGLKEGSTTVTVSVINSNDFFDNKKIYYFDVNKNLDVIFKKVENANIEISAFKEYVLNETCSLEQNIDIKVSDESIIKATKDNQTTDENGGVNTLFIISGLKEGKTTATVTITNSDGSVASNKTYSFEVNQDLVVNLID